MDLTIFVSIKRDLYLGRGSLVDNFWLRVWVETFGLENNCILMSVRSVRILLSFFCTH